MKLSNFLLWRAATAVFLSTPVFWPDFQREHLQEAIRIYPKHISEQPVGSQAIRRIGFKWRRRTQAGPYRCVPDEVIIADAGSTDGTEEIARAHGARVISGGMPAAGRNAGARAAGGDLLLFLDADVLPPTDFIARSLEEFERKEFDVATCFIAALDENPLDRILSTGTNLYFRVIQPVSPHAPGFCIFSKRVTHEKMGGFDETLILSEDIDYARRAKQYGKFGFLTSTRIPVSMRRVGKEGLVGIGYKYAWCEMYALAGKPVRAAPFKYEFGTFGPPLSSASRSLINTGEMHRQWKKVMYPLQRFGFKIRDQFDQ